MSVSLKLPFRQLLACAALALSLLLCTVAGRLSPAAVMETAAVSDDALRSYLASYGWETDDTAPVTDQVVLPETFGSAYEDYLDCQRICGLPLEEYAGRTVTRYSYRIVNYPTGERSVQADLLVCDGEVVGGDIRSADLDGFLHSLIYPG